uniref:Uncharacterized protein n=1 Tax=Salix viminalis TaxID=40686 RepID=A0A6N2KLJ4_SALVM
METFKKPYHYQKGNFERQRSNHTIASFVVLFITTKNIISSLRLHPQTISLSLSHSFLSLCKHKAKSYSILQIPYLPLKASSCCVPYRAFHAYFHNLRLVENGNCKCCCGIPCI